MIVIKQKVARNKPVGWKAILILAVVLLLTLGVALEAEITGGAIIEVDEEGSNFIQQAFFTGLSYFAPALALTVNEGFLTIAAAPVMVEVILNATSDENLTSDNLTAYARATDSDGGTLNYSGYWYKNGEYQLEQLWNVTTGENKDDAAADLAFDGTYLYVTGTNTFELLSVTYNNVWTIKYDLDGNQIWNVTAGGTYTQDQGLGVAVDDAGNIYVTGYTDTYGAGGKDVWTLKYNSTGGLVWNRTAGGTGDDKGYDVVVDGSGNVYVAGYTNSYGAGNYDTWLIKYDSSGNHIFNRTLGGTNEDQARGIALDASGNIYMTGYTKSYGAGGRDTWTIKYDSSGNQVWNVTSGGGADDAATGVAVDVDGNIYITVETYSYGAGGRDVWTIKYDSSGNHLWNVTAGGSSDEWGSAVALDDFGNVYVVGQTFSFGAGSYDVWMLKYNSTADLLWNETVGGTDLETGNDLVVDSTGSIFVAAGTSSFGAGGNDVWMLRYDDGFAKLGQTQGQIVLVDTIDSAELVAGDNWGVCVQSFDGSDYTNAVCSGLLEVQSVIPNVPANISNVGIIPDPAYTNDTLNCSADYVDSDDASGGTINFEWFKNGVSLGLYNDSVANGSTGSVLLGSENFVKDEVIICGARADDGENASAWVNSSSLTISNSVTTVDQLILNSTSPGDLTTDNLTAYVEIGDADGGIVYANYTWYKNGGADLSGQSEALSEGVLSLATELGSGNTTVGENWSICVTSYDGEAYGSESCSTNITVGQPNRAANITGTAILQTVAYTNTDLNCSANYSDADGDPGTVNFEWYKNGVNVYTEDVVGVADGGTANVSLDNANFTKKDVLICSARGDDGEDLGEWVNSSSLTISNSICTIGGVTFSATSSANLTTDNLTAVPVNVQDTDGDDVTIIYDWRMGGVSINSLLMPFDVNLGMAIDYTTRGNNGTVTGATWTANGYDGGAYVFDGVNDYITINGADSDFDAAAYSVLVKIKTNDASTQTIISKQTGTATGWEIGIGSGQLNVILRGSVDCEALNLGLVNDGAWHQVGFTFDGSKLVTYLDDQTQEQACPNHDNDDNHNVLIGRKDEGFYFNGTIDNVFIYNRTLSAAQVAALNANLTDVLVSAETALAESWSVVVNTNDEDALGGLVESAALTILNSVPVVSQIVLNSSSGNNYSADDLTVYTNITDADGGNVYANYTWYKNGLLHSSGQSGVLSAGVLSLAATLGSGNTSVGENWSVCVTGWDGEDYGSESCSANITIIQTPNLIPEVSSVAISPGTAYGDTELNCSADYADGNGEAGTIYFEWFKNEVSVYLDSVGGVANGGSASVILDSANFTKDDNITCGARAHDGLDYSNWVNSSVLTISSSAPSVVELILNSTSYGFTSDNLTAYVNISDADGGNVYANYTWYKNGIESLSGQSGALSEGVLSLAAVLGSGNTTEGDDWSICVTPYDGDVYGVEDCSTNITIVSPGCLNLSDENTYFGRVQNVSGVYRVYEDTLLCRDTYNIETTGAIAALTIYAAGVTLDCNGSTFQGIDDGYGIANTQASFSNTIIKNCNLSDYKYGIYLWNSVNHLIDNVSILSSKTTGIHLNSNTENITVANSYFKNNVHWDIELKSNTVNILIENNTFVNQTSSYGDRSNIRLDQSSGVQYVVVIRNNQFYGQDINAYALYSEKQGDYNLSVINNTFRDYKRVFYYRGDYTRVINNSFYDATSYALKIDYADDWEVTGNTFDNTNEAIQIGADSARNVIHSNYIENSGGYGVVTHPTSCVDNLIYNNYFSNNSVNGWERGANFWNTSKTLGTNIIGGSYIGGNYWDDYNGTDADADGIGDTEIPYNKNGTLDYLPLTNTFVPPAQVTNDGAEATNLDSYNETTIQQVVNYTWHKTGKGKIKWKNPVNLSGTNIGGDNDLDNDIFVGDKIVSVNTATAPAFANQEVTITFENMDCNFCNAENIIYAPGTYTSAAELAPEGQSCGSLGKCSDFSCVANECSFAATSFSGYAGGENASNALLTIFDAAEGTYALANTSISFYADYENKSSGVPISTASCNITFDDNPGTWYPMSWNGTGNNVYNYTKAAGFAANGLHSWNVTCAHVDFTNLLAEDNVTIGMPAAVPEFSDYALILLFVTIVGGFFYIRKK